MLEAELKASLEGLPTGEPEAAMEALGFIPARVLRQRDDYYNAPDRDFRVTDEALRLRWYEENGVSRVILTYKGPKLGQAASSRTEHETQVLGREQTEKLLLALGYTPAYQVEKLRREFTLGDVTLCLDQVKGLGRYLELELLIPDGGDRKGAENRLLSLLDRLGVSRTALTRSSYLELLYP